MPLTPTASSSNDFRRDWHQGKHDVWPWIAYLSRIISSSYDDFEAEIAAAGELSGTKQDRVREYVLRRAPPRFRRRDIERALPGISLATIRLVLTELRDGGQIKPEGSGASAHWNRL